MRKTSSDIQNASNAGPGTLVDVPVTQKHEQTPFTNTPYTPPLTLGLPLSLPTHARAVTRALGVTPVPDEVGAHARGGGRE